MAVRAPTSFFNRPGLKSKSLDTSLEYESGAVYCGHLEDKAKEGSGVFTWPNGDVYDGQYKNNRRNGKGKQSWADGDSYDGDYIDDVREGKGVYHWNNGDRYEGQFFRDHRHGFGKYTYSDGSVFMGMFYMDRREGYGLFTYPGMDADRFAGLYHMDEREGPGVLTYKNGQVDVGLWRRERLSRLLSITTDGGGFSVKQFPEVEYFPEEHKLYLPHDGIDEGAERDPLLDFFSDVVFPPDPLDYDPLATATVRRQLSSALRRDTDVQSEGFDRDTINERFEEELEQQEIKSERTVSARSVRSAKSAKSGRSLRSGKKTPSIKESCEPVLAWNNTPSCVRMQRHVLRFRRWENSVPVDVESIIMADRSNFPESGPLERDSLCLIEASRSGDVRYACEILDTGLIDPDVADKLGRSPLLEAAVNWHLEMVNLLLDFGADVNKLNDEGLSALSACMLQYYPPSTFKRNIAEDSPIEVRPQDLVSRGPSMPPSTAARKKRTVTVATTSGVKSDSGGMASDTFLMNKMKTVPEAAEEEAHQNTPSADSGFHQEAITAPPGRFGGALSEEGVRKPNFIASTERWEYDSAMDPSDYFSQKPLYSSLGRHITDEISLDGEDEHAMRFEEFDSRNSLVDFPIEVTDQLLGRCATALSAIDGVVNRIRVESAPKTPQGRVREMAIQMSRHALMESMLHLLLRRGADPNASCVPMPCVFYPLKAADVEMVRLLLLKGVNANAKLSDKKGGLYPIHIAAALPGEEGVRITELLLHALADPDSRAYPDESFRDKTLEEEWSKDNITAEQQSILGGRTALHIACVRDTDYKNAQKVVRLLLEHHANPNLLCNGHSPLSLAITSGNDGAIDDLLSNSANASLPLTHGVGSALCVASSTFYEHRRTVEGRLNLINRLVKAGADMLAPINIGPKRAPGTAVDYAYAIYNMDRRIAHMPYHALTHSERETFNARRRLLGHLGSVLREKAVERERKRLEATERIGVQSRGPSPNFVYTGAGASMPAKDGGAGGPGSIRRGESRVSFEDPNQLMRQTTEMTTRKPMFKYCYECGRSVGVRLTACTRCKEVFYCSKACKLKAWNARHKEECVRVGGRGMSGKSKDPSRIDSPTPATDPERGNRHVEVDGLLKDALRNKNKNRYTRFPKLNKFQYAAVKKSGLRHGSKSANAATQKLKLPPIDDRNHPSYSYQYLAGRYVKVDMRERSIICEPLDENYSFE